MRFIFFLLISFSFPNNLTLESSIDTNVAYIGDVFLWSVKAKGDSLKNINFPKLEIKSESITIKGQGFYKSNNIINGTYFYLTAWDTGDFLTPEYYVTVFNKDSTIKSRIEAKKINFNVKSILFDKQADDFRPIKGPVPVKDFIRLKLIFLALIILIILFLLYRIIRDREKYIYQKRNYVKNKDPKKTVTERLESLKSNKLVKDFYTELSHILRQYVEDKYFIRTLEMTTIEIRKNRDLFNFNDEDFLFWVSFLDKADKVKYSKEIFSIKEMENDKKNMVAWVEKN